MFRAFRDLTFVFVMTLNRAPAVANTETEFVIAVYSPAHIDNTYIESQYVTGARLFFDEINSLGGIQGRKIKILTHKLAPPRDRFIRKLQEEDIKNEIQKNGTVSIIYLEIPRYSEENSIAASSLDGTPVLNQTLGRKIAGKSMSWLGESNSMVENVFSNLARRGAVRDTDQTLAMSEGFLTACGLARSLRMNSDKKSALIQRFSRANVQSYCGYLSANQIRYLMR